MDGPALDPPVAVNNATGKRLLALVRDGDYAHPGEEAANELLFAGLRPDPHRRFLDAGCGGGGTASWVQARGLGAVAGIEVDAATARLARERHPEVGVVQGDVQLASVLLPGEFDVVYSMTALYAVPDQAAAFRELGALAAPGAELRLFEYSDPYGRFARATSGSASWGWWRPLAPRDLPEVLAAAGWTSVRTTDLHAEFVHWYASLCTRIAARERAIVRAFGRDWYDFAAADYAGILDLVRSCALGGVLVRARLAAG
jgi:SAM-dependent methyltransferase